MIYRAIIIQLASLLMLAVTTLASMPLPWKRELYYDNETPLTGNDVIIMQNLINRDPSVHGRLEITGAYDAASARAVQAFQHYHKLAITGILDEPTATLLLETCSRDGVTDTGFTAASMG